ncbi:hypothetical protein DFJ73DRAFT_394167 [Zopfochytrium polystomum]|nr:hypothetical protein DFJ73DRAFT_394167 [Zopfochytrium polystomum]
MSDPRIVGGIDVQSVVIAVIVVCAIGVVLIAIGYVYYLRSIGRALPRWLSAPWNKKARPPAHARTTTAVGAIVGSGPGADGGSGGGGAIGHKNAYGGYGGSAGFPHHLHDLEDGDLASPTTTVSRGKGLRHHNPTTSRGGKAAPAAFPSGFVTDSSSVVTDDPWWEEEDVSVIATKDTPAPQPAWHSPASDTISLDRRSRISDPGVSAVEPSNPAFVYSAGDIHSDYQPTSASSSSSSSSKSGNRHAELGGRSRPPPASGTPSVASGPTPRAPAQLRTQSQSKGHQSKPAAPYENPFADDAARLDPPRSHPAVDPSLPLAIQAKAMKELARDRQLAADAPAKAASPTGGAVRQPPPRRNPEQRAIAVLEPAAEPALPTSDAKGARTAAVTSSTVLRASMINDAMLGFQFVNDENAPPVPAIPSTPKDSLVCLRPYKKKLDDELELAVGDRVEVIDTYPDNWAKGKNINTDKIGIFPLSAVVAAPEGSTLKILDG